MIDGINEETHEKYWDFKVKNGILQTVDYTVATKQRSIIATYLQRGTVPQLPDVGNQWVEFITGTIMPNTLNGQIRKSIMELTGQLAYMPKYSEDNGQLKVEVVEV